MIRVVDSPLGSLTLVASQVGLARVGLPGEDVDDLPGSSSALDAAARQLEEYFAGRRRKFDLALDRSLATDFARRVQDVMLGVKYGKTITYAEAAGRLGRPSAARAVGSACGANPIPIIVPCHRIVRLDGTLGGYRGGTAAKQFLLRLERAPEALPSSATADDRTAVDDSVVDQD